MSLIKKLIAGKLIVSIFALAPLTPAIANDHLKELISVFGKKGNPVQNIDNKVSSRFIGAKIQNTDYWAELNYGATNYFVLEAKDITNSSNSLKLTAYNSNLSTATYSGNWNVSKTSSVIGNLLDYLKR